MQKKNGGTARIALLINSPLFAKLRGVLRKCGTGSHAPDRQKSCSPPQRLLCANNGRSIFAPNTSIQKLTFFCFFCFSMKALDFLFFESYIINKKILFIEGFSFIIFLISSSSLSKSEAENGFSTSKS